MICKNKDKCEKARTKKYREWIQNRPLEERLDERDFLQLIRNKQRESNWAKKAEAL